MKHERRGRMCQTTDHKIKQQTELYVSIIIITVQFNINCHSDAVNEKKERHSGNELLTNKAG